MKKGIISKEDMDYIRNINKKTLILFDSGMDKILAKKNMEERVKLFLIKNKKK